MPRSSLTRASSSADAFPDGTSSSNASSQRWAVRTASRCASEGSATRTRPCVSRSDAICLPNEGRSIQSASDIFDRAGIAVPS